MIVEFKADGRRARVEVAGMTEAQHGRIVGRLRKGLEGRPAEVRTDAIVGTMALAVRTCPRANPADLWGNVIYRNYGEFVDSENWDNSWVHASGMAFERWLILAYGPRLVAAGVRLRLMSRAADREAILERCGLAGRVRPSDVDIVAEREGGGLGVRGGWGVVGFVHCKTSVAERMKEDVDASLAMIRVGLRSVFCTLDAYAPRQRQGDYAMHGGFYGLKSRPRALAESRKAFDAVFSWNSNTLPSPRVKVVGSDGAVFTDWVAANMR